MGLGQATWAGQGASARPVRMGPMNGYGLSANRPAILPAAARGFLSLTIAVGGIGLAGLTACGEVPDASDTSLVRDSAGVAIVENRGDVWAAPRLRRLSSEPVLRIGAVEGEDPYLFDGVRGIVALGDGRLVVANAGTNTLRWFDGEGTFLFERGGSGEGPGEFSYLGNLTRAGADTLLATDWGARRVVAYASDGTHAGTTSLAVLPGPAGSVFRLSDGTYVTGVSGFSSSQLPPDQKPGRLRVPTPLIRLSSDGGRADTLGLFPGMEIWLRQIGGGMGFGPPPFARNLSYGAADDQVYVGTAETFTIDVYAPGGEFLRSIRAPDVDLSLGDAEVDAYLQRLRARASELPEEQRAQAERELGEMVFPESRPAYGKFLVGSQGGLWVSEFSSDTSTGSLWAHFDPGGRVREVVETPPGFVPLDFEADRIWGRTTDDLGVEYVVAYTLEPL